MCRLLNSMGAPLAGGSMYIELADERSMCALFLGSEIPPLALQAAIPL